MISQKREFYSNFKRFCDFIAYLITSHVNVTKNNKDEENAKHMTLGVQHTCETDTTHVCPLGPSKFCLSHFYKKCVSTSSWDKLFGSAKMSGMRLLFKPEEVSWVFCLFR